LHEDDFELELNYLSKIEGHADLLVSVRKNKVVDAKLKIYESKRFFTQAIRGTNFALVPQMVSRICGTCSTAHLCCATEAVEEAIGLQPSEQTILLRKLAMYAAFIRDHAMHLYFFVLPDFFGKDSVLDFQGAEQQWLKDGFKVKGVGNKYAKWIGGRAIHPPYLQVGGIAKVPKKEEAKAMAAELRGIRPAVLKLIDYFYKDKHSFTRTTHFACVINKDFSYCGDEIIFSDGRRVVEEEYFDHLQRVIVPYSTSTGYQLEGSAFMVGALARMNLNRGSLHRDTRKDVSKWLKAFPTKNIFRNNLAQAIEILHAIDASVEALETMDFKQEPVKEHKAKAGIGVAAIEAPRGTLYYMVDVGADGLVRDGNLVIPTQQNQVNMEKDMKTLVQSNIRSEKHEIQHKLEELIRAYDPCMSCASHFLKLKMEEVK